MTMQQLQSYQLYITPQGEIVQAYTREHFERAGGVVIETPRFVAILENTENYAGLVALTEQVPDFYLAYFLRVKAWTPGYTVGYYIDARGNAYADRYIGRITLVDGPYQYDITNIEAGQLALYLAERTQNDLISVKEDTRLDERPAFTLQELLVYDTDFWATELADLQL